MPELRQLRVFVAVAEELNFTRAASRLHMAQQAVSKSVKQLERELGVALLERTTREVRLTEAGAGLLERGREVLSLADAAFARARDQGRGLVGTVRVGVSPAVGAPVRDEVVRVLRDGAPEVVVSLVEVRPGDVARLLEARSVDVVLTRSMPPEVPGLESMPLASSRAAVCVSVGHRLAGRERVSVTELDGERLMVWNPPGTVYTDMLLGRLADLGVHVEPVEARVVGSHTLDELAELDAVAILPVGWPLGGSVVGVLLDETFTLPLMVVWPAGPMPPAARRLRQGMGA